MTALSGNLDRSKYGTHQVLALFLAVTFIGHYTPLGPTIDSGERLLHNVVVAKVEIPAGTRIIAEQLEVAKFPANLTPEGAIGIIDDKIVGRVVQVAISTRDPITESQLAPIGAAGGLLSMIPDGYRAMTVKVNDSSGVSGFIIPGSFLDVVVVISPPKSSAIEELISKVVLQNMRVLAIGKNMEKLMDDRGVESSIKVATLQVTPEQAEKLVLASSEGKLQLVMRNS